MIEPLISKALTIAGSDSGGGAGIQADLKTFAALGVYGASVITSVTAQNTLAVTTYQEVSTEVIRAQIDAVMTDIGAGGVKSGMLSSPAIIETVAAGIEIHGIRNYVLDPVMVAKSGDRLLLEEAIGTLKRRLLPLALIVTPNIPEAEVLAGRQADSEKDLLDLARVLHDMGPPWVLLKGGHRKGAAEDLLFNGKDFEILTAERLETKNTHGTGCSLSAAMAAGLAAGYSVPEAVLRAKQFVTAAMKEAFSIGAGHSPIHHFFAMDDAYRKRLEKCLAQSDVERKRTVT